MVLSACETATGERQAALGLAGIAVRSGARSTLASLWTVSDEATVMLMTNFYRELRNNNISKAEAIGRAQQTVLQNEEFSHPYFVQNAEEHVICTRPRYVMVVLHYNIKRLLITVALINLDN